MKTVRFQEKRERIRKWTKETEAGVNTAKGGDKRCTRGGFACGDNEKVAG